MWLHDLLRALVLPALVVCGLGPIDAWQRRAPAGAPPLDGATRVAAAFALALGWMELGGMVLGFGHGLHAAAVIAWTAAGAAAGLACRPRLALPKPSPWTALAIVALAGYAAMALYPPWDRDEMVYHLALPRAFAQAGGYVRPDDNIFASFPLGYESALAMLHAVGAPPDFDPWFDPRLVGVAAAGAAAAATVGLARTIGARGSAPLAGVLLLLVPSFVEVGSSAYAEAPLVLATTLALAFAVRAAGGDRRSATPASLFAAMAIGTKYSGLVWTALIAGALFLDALGRDPKGQVEAVARAARFLALALLLGAPFYVRNAIERGNPFFPVAYGLFGGRGWDAIRAEAYWETLRGYGAGGGLAPLTASIRVFVARDFLHGFEGSIGPVIGLGAVAGAWLCARPAEGAERRPVALLLVVLGGFAVAFSMTVVQARYFLAAVPPLAAMLAFLVDARAPRAPLVRAGLCAASLAWGAGGYAHLWTRQPTWAWLTGRLTVDEARATMLPESYVPMRGIEAFVPPTGRVALVWMRGYTYYLRRPCVLDSVFEEWRIAEAIEAARTPSDLARALAARGVTHLLVNERRLLRDGSADTRPGRTEALRDKWERAIAEGALVPRAGWAGGAVVLYEVKGSG